MDQPWRTELLKLYERLDHSATILNELVELEGKVHDYDDLPLAFQESIKLAWDALAVITGKEKKQNKSLAV